MCVCATSLTSLFVVEFVLQETHKFRAELSRKLLKDKATFGDDFNSVIDVCAQVEFSSCNQTQIT